MPLSATASYLQMLEICATVGRVPESSALFSRLLFERLGGRHVAALTVGEFAALIDLTREQFAQGRRGAFRPSMPTERA